MTPRVIGVPPRRAPALVWSFSRLTPLTPILCWSGMVRSTSPCLPLSLPATTITGSPGARSSQRRLGSALLRSIGLQNLRSQRNDLHEVALAQLAGNGAEDARPARVVRSRQQHLRVLVEADERAIGPPVFLVDADHDRLDDLALLDLAAWLRRLDGGGDDVAHRRVLAVVPAGHADAKDLLGTRVVPDLQASLLLNHSGTTFRRQIPGSPRNRRFRGGVRRVPCWTTWLSCLSPPRA